MFPCSGDAGPVVFALDEGRRGRAWILRLAMCSGDALPGVVTDNLENTSAVPKEASP